MSIKLITTIEIPKFSKIKYEYNRVDGSINVDRILYGSSGYPQNYGFIKDALDWDGDELDVLVIADQSFQTAVNVPTRIIGAMEMIDGGETDTKLIGVIDCDPRYETFNKLSDIPKHWLDEIQDFFQTYKNLQKKTVVIKGFRDEKWAEKELNECRDLMKKYGKMDKDEFIKKMKIEHPEKYIK